MDPTSSSTWIPIMDWELAAADSLDQSFSTIRFTVAFFLSVVAGVLFRFVPTTRGRHLYSAVTGFLLIYYPFGNSAFALLFPAAVTYLAMLRLRQHAATLSWLVTFSFLLYCHVSSASGKAWKEGRLDVTGAMMVLTLKIISVAACYQDGGKPQAELSEYQREHSLDRMLSPLEFASYLFSVGNLLSGPFFEARDYVDFIDKKGVWAAPLPQPYVQGLMRLLKGIICAALHITMTRYFPVTLLESPHFLSLRLLHKIPLTFAVTLTYRMRYYFAWAVSESSLIFSGLCFNGHDSASGRPRWDRCVNARIRKVELGSSAAQLPQDWNIATGNFMRRYVYERLTAPGRKPSLVTLVITQAVSGLWHGVFAGYALMFVSCAFFFHSSKVLFKYERSWSPAAQRNILWRFFKLAYTQITLQYLGSAFVTLYFKEAFAVWRSMHFMGHFMIGAILLIGVVFPPRSPRKAQQAVAPGGAAQGAHPRIIPKDDASLKAE